MVELWKSLIAMDLVEIGFHGREHWNVPLYMDLVSQDGPYRETAAQGRIPYRDDIYNRLFKGDHRLDYLQRSFIDASHDPPLALEPAMQEQIIRDGMEMLRQQLGVRPRIAVAPGHVYDLSTCRATGRGRRDVPGNDRKCRSSTLAQAARFSRRGFCADRRADLAGLLPVLRTEGYEPTWRSAFGPAGQYWSIRTALVRGQPVVLSTHKAAYVGPDETAKATHREELADLIRRVQREFPDVVFLSSADLGCYLHGRPNEAHRQVDFSLQPLNFVGRAAFGSQNVDVLPL